MLHELLSLPEQVGKVDPALFEALKIDLHPEPDLAQQMLIHGYFDCLPIGRVGTDYLLALRAFPGRTLAQCPVVLLHPKTAGSRIISDQLGGAIPSLLIDLLYDCPDVLWDMFALAPADVRQEVLDVHLALGGQEANLTAFWKVLEDPQARDIMVQREGSRSFKQTTQLMTFQQEIMRGLPRAAYVQFLEIVRSLETRKAPNTAAMGAWAPLAWMMHCHNREGWSELNADERRHMMWMAACVPAHHEAPHSLTLPNLGFNDSILYGGGPIRLATETLLEHYPTLAETHPLIKASAHMLSNKRTYEGLAHAEAAAVLHADGDPLAISAMLTCAHFGWWRFGAPNTAIVHGYRALVHEQGASPHIEIIDRLLGSTADDVSPSG